MSHNTFLFEISWEVCNKIGGIYTVLATKAPVLAEKYGSNHIFIGPDIVKEAENIDFIEDYNLFSDWKVAALSQGLNLRVGRWNIESKPIAILVDFTPFFSQRDSIFTDFWNKYKLDSLSGQWDYIEPAMFGYASAKVVESFCKYNYDSKSFIIAHFHEWMTGSGILYIKEKAPYISTVFTTHATTLGRCLAGNNMPLYGQMNSFNFDIISKQYNIVAKYSLEKVAAEQADVFTTVSEITAHECSVLLQKNVDVITPNGFDDLFIKSFGDLAQTKESSKKILIKTSEAVLGTKLNNPYFILNSGRYEFKNKGIDVFIDALKNIETEINNQDRDIVAIIAVPANHRQPFSEIVERLNDRQTNDIAFLSTHHIVDSSKDPIINKLKELNIDNTKKSKLKIIFAPVYLDGLDGVFNKVYYEILNGFDLTVFPSYYEPWGYTPMESIAFGIPTITTSLAGFGQWIKNNIKENDFGAKIIERTDDNILSTIDEIGKSILNYISMNESQIESSVQNAYSLSSLTLWNNLISNYITAYKMAIKKIESRKDAIYEQMYNQKGTNFNQLQNQTPIWKKALVKQNLPKKLQPILELSQNLWWTWNYSAAEMYKSIDPVLWKKVEFNPIALIEAMDISQINELENNTQFMSKLESVYSNFKQYMSKKEQQYEDKIAYFSMEFGLHDTIKIFSGGLGILAGDFIKEASDNNVNIVAIGLLYRYGYFKQEITRFGDQLAIFSPQKFTHLPLIPVLNEVNEWITIKISLPGHILHAKLWKLNVGRVELYLLDTDIDENTASNRHITDQLYGGDHNNRFLQELLLGVGGIRALEALNIKPTFYHCNEGHAAMIGVERLRKFIVDSKLSFEEAKEIVRSSTLFTTHTPVPAGHDTFEEDLIRTYLPHYASRLNLKWEDFMALGRVNKEDSSEKFSMSILAAQLSQGMNGVSKIHGRVSREMFSNMFPGYYPNELYISYVTNGVHLPTWASKRWSKLYEKIDPTFFENQEIRTNWKKIYDIPDTEIFELRNGQRKKLMQYLKVRLEDEMKEKMQNPQHMVKVLSGLKDDVLTVGFARRFATYKRAQLLFTDLEALDKLVNNPTQPIQFIFAGKAHPADGAGQDLIKHIVEISKLPQFEGKIIFVENYDIGLAKRLVSGVDVWLNNPTRPLEASGTSGEKAIMNGVLNFSVLDGWWAEGYKEDAGWALSEETIYNDDNQQNILDASLMYNIFENEIAEVFYDKDENGISSRWIKMIKNNIFEIAPEFTTKRMLDDYVRKYYSPQIERTKMLVENKFAKAKEIAKWKSEFIQNWKLFEVVHVEYPDSNTKSLNLGDNFLAKVYLRIFDCLPQNIGVEIVFGEKEDQEVKRVMDVIELNFIKIHDGVAHYEIDIPVKRAGVFNFSFRVFPKHELLPHRQDFPLVKWI